MLCRAIRQCALVVLLLSTRVLAFAQAAPAADVAQASPAAAPAAASPASPAAINPVPQSPAAGGALPNPAGNAIAQAAPPVNPAAGANPAPAAIAQATPPAGVLPAANSTGGAAPVNPAGNSATANSVPTPSALNPAATPAQPAAPPAVPEAMPAISSQFPALNPGGIQIQGLKGESVPWSIVILLTGLTLIPTLLLCVTPFARLLIVFHFLRQALGLQTTPSNQTLIGLSLILTFFLMQPVGQQIYDAAIVPMQAGQITSMEALGRGEAPMRKFMAHYVREKDVALFIELAKEPRPHTVDDLSMRVLLPAYILSELKAGFQIGTVLFLPFLIVDMVVASITTSVGMLQLPPVIISTPLKLLLFLMVDGWHLLISSLMRSFS
jgi:flagellar biosynthesis protein FliP